MAGSIDLASEVQLVGSHLLERLAQPGEPSLETVTACRRLFLAVGETALVRWLDCEINGYERSGAVSLRELLGVPDDSPLAARVRSYRQYVGRVRTLVPTASGRPLQVPYFFGESLQTLRHCRANADALGTDVIEVELIPTAADPALVPSGAPVRTLEFPRYIFYRILSGLAVELEIAVRDILQRATNPGSDDA
ncbi:MAG: hypothetical protein RMK29_19195 [Myxococcales bacterium]|nr:hypothetical protein [Myxococcota bacterium]MDW8283832.1 hypothetical protein [Myxococcales bacterium]